jgi:hypothetical protein
MSTDETDETKGLRLEQAVALANLYRDEMATTMEHRNAWHVAAVDAMNSVGRIAKERDALKSEVEDLREQMKRVREDAMHEAAQRMAPTSVELLNRNVLPALQATVDECREILGLGDFDSLTDAVRKLECQRDDVIDACWNAVGTTGKGRTLPAAVFEMAEENKRLKAANHELLCALAGRDVKDGEGVAYEVPEMVPRAKYDDAVKQLGEANAALIAEMQKTAARAQADAREARAWDEAEGVAP